MTTRNEYEKQVDLLIKVLPHVAKESCFAIKGGTALNLFLRDLPRLSVDIDLTYLPLHSRNEALAEMDSTLIRIKKSVMQSIPAVSITENYTKPERHINKLFIKTPTAQIKIEPNFIVRGTVFPVQNNNLCQTAKEYFKMDVTDVALLSFADLYAGKICAALKRQHPRDLFDVKLLFEHEGITPEICKALVVYLASDSRPMHELLSPNIKQDQKTVFENEFKDMVTTETTYSDLMQILPVLITSIKQKFTQEEKAFLLSISHGEPAWDLLGLPHLSQLPALKWKVQNVKIMTEEKRLHAVRALEESLAV